MVNKLARIINWSRLPNLVTCGGIIAMVGLAACTFSEPPQLSTATMSTPSAMTMNTPPVTSSSTTPSTWQNALFIALSTDQTRLVAAYAGTAELKTLYQFAAPYQAQVTFYPADFPIISTNGVWVTVVEEAQRTSAGIQRISLRPPVTATWLLHWPGSLFEASISADGKRVAFLATEQPCISYEEHGESYGCPKQVYVMDSDGTRLKSLTVQAADRCFLSWSPTNQHLAYQEICDPAAASLPQVYVITVAADNTPAQVTQIATEGTLLPRARATWSSTGEWLQWVTYTQNAGGSYWLSHINAKGQIITEQASGLPQGLVAGGSWAPNTPQLAAITSENILAIWDLPTGNLTQIPLTNIQARQPQKWLTDGQHLVFANCIAQQQTPTLPCQWQVVDAKGTPTISFNMP